MNYLLGLASQIYITGLYADSDYCTCKFCGLNFYVFDWKKIGGVLIFVVIMAWLHTYIYTAHKTSYQYPLILLPTTVILATVLFTRRPGNGLLVAWQ